MKLTGAILLITAATTVLAAGIRDDVVYKDCTYTGLRHCTGTGWYSVIKNGRCHCERRKTEAERMKENTDNCSYSQKLCYDEGIKVYRDHPIAQNSCGKLQTCSPKAYKALCRKAVVEKYAFQCMDRDIHLTAEDKKEIADRAAKKKAEEAKRKKDEADQEADGKKAYCAIIKPDCYEKGSTHKNYNDKRNSCNEMKDVCSKEENNKMCADAKKNKWKWQCN